ncbi:MAG: DUF2142 domain-containing protein [Candidatus Moraniibacteriota bacterium]
MNIIRNIFDKTREKLVSHKADILKALSCLIAIGAIAAGIEYFAFGHTLRSLPLADQGIRTVPIENVVTDGFTKDENGDLVSQTENATLTISKDARHVENLVVGLGGTPNYFVSISYRAADSSDKQVIGTKDLAKYMTKGGYDFLHSISFPVRTEPESVTVTAKDPGTVISEIRIDNTFRFNPYRFLFVFTALFLVAFLFAFRKRIGAHPEYAFLVIALSCGTLSSVSEPRAYTSWDEHIHYTRADNVSLKEILPKKIKDIYANTNYFPYSLSLDEQRVIDDHFDHDYKTAAKTKKSSKSDPVKPTAIFDAYLQICYLPSGLTLFAGRALHVPPHVVFVLGQWVNLLVFTALIFFAIRRLKTGKMILAVIALFPTSIFLAGNYSYDPWVTGFTALGLAYFFSTMQEPEKKLTRQEMIIMIGSLVIGCAAKAIYFPVFFLLFLLPSSVFASKRHYRNFIIALFVAILFVVASFAVPFLGQEKRFNDTRGGSGVNAMGQVRFILSDPVAYAGILLSFLKGYLNPMNTGGTIVSFAYLDGTKGFQILLALIAIVTLTDRNAYDKRTTALTRFLTLTVFLATVALIATALYISFTPVGLKYINGVQTRYLLPLVFPFLFVFGASRFGIPVKYRNLYHIVIFGIMAIVTLQGIWDLVISLYY